MCNLCKLPQRISEIYPRSSLSTSTPHPAGCRGMLHPLSARSHEKTQSSSFKRPQRAGISCVPAGTGALGKSVGRILPVGHLPDWISLASTWITNRLLNCTAYILRPVGDSAATARHSRGGWRFVSDPARQEESSYYSLISKRELMALSHQKGETSCWKAKHQTGLLVGFLRSPFLYLSFTCLIR